MCLESESFRRVATPPALLPGYLPAQDTANNSAEVRELLALATKRAHAQIQNVIATIANSNLVGIEAVNLAEFRPQARRRRIGIKPELSADCPRSAFQHLGRRLDMDSRWY